TEVCRVDAVQCWRVEGLSGFRRDDLGFEGIRVDLHAPTELPVEDGGPCANGEGGPSSRADDGGSARDVPAGLTVAPGAVAVVARGKNPCVGACRPQLGGSGLGVEFEMGEEAGEGDL